MNQKLRKIEPQDWLIFHQQEPTRAILFCEIEVYSDEKLNNIQQNNIQHF